jgi:hypothetical protein
MKALTAVLLICFAVSMSAFSQSSNATLGGTISDASGALIPGVTISATNTQTGIVTTIVSNEAGAYQLASLQPGTYKVSAELAGFQSQVYNDVALGVSQQVRLNFTLQVGTVTQAVEVSVAADTLIATTSASIGAVLPEYKVRDLPLTNRSVLELVQTTAGVRSSNFAGSRGNQVNTTRDGISVNDQRYEGGVGSSTYLSQDLVDEVRIIVAPADAETGRGSGQVQVSTRSGTNQFRGSLFWQNRNSVLDANTWTNNFNGVGKNYLNRNWFGGRLGGPIVRNKTFFFVLFEGQRSVSKTPVLASVYTAEARQGIFRYFPGVQNGNALSNTTTGTNPTAPVVDRLGNPVRPAAATGDLTSFSVFGRDPLRPGMDPSGLIQKFMAGMPLPNDFTTGDGLNTAGYRWVRRLAGSTGLGGTGINADRNQFNMRLDHQINTYHKVSFNLSREYDWSQSDQASYPTGFSGEGIRHPRTYTGSLVSTLSPTVVNEVRIGYTRGGTFSVQAFDVTRDQKAAEAARAFLPVYNGFPAIVKTNVSPTAYFNDGGFTGSTGSLGNNGPRQVYGDTISWARGKHAFRGGFELRLAGSLGWNTDWIVPRVNLGAGGFPVPIDSTTVAGLVGNNQNNARNLLVDLAGSVGEVRQGFNLSGSANPVFKDYLELYHKERDFHQNEWSAFFKDDWKVRPNLTLNLGLRYEYVGAVWEAKGLAARPVGGKAGLFGISGTGFADMYQPARLNGNLTTVEFVGKKSPQPGKQLWNTDWNNFGPAIGLSWSLPWFGKDRTVLRAGYGISYQGGGQALSVDSRVGSMPGVNQFAFVTPANYTNLTNVALPLPRGTPLQPVPLTDRGQTMYGYEDERRVPYIQNWSVELQRELLPSLTLEMRYVASKGTKLFGGVPLNEVNIFENGILEAFRITQTGGNAKLFDDMLRGINLGNGVVNGTTLTGSAALRANTTTRGYIANGDVGTLADFLNRNSTGTGENGGLLRRNGFAENFIVVNPQFNTLWLDGNPGNSTYHSMQLQVTKRLSQGVTNQTSYTWSRAIGENDGDGGKSYRNARNRSLDRSLLGYHRTHDIRSNGTFELPFGPNRSLLSNAPGWVSRLVERWQLGGILSWSSGAPLTVGASTFSWNQLTSGTPVIVGDFAKSIGKVVEVANGAIYFDGLQQVNDPGGANITSLQGTNGSFTNRAIADSQGRLLLINPAPGELGNLGLRWIEGPSDFSLDVNLIKRIRISETKELEFRADAFNVLNHANWGDPTVDINSNNFGRITSATGSRTFNVGGRFTF